MASTMTCGKSSMYCSAAECSTREVCFTQGSRGGQLGVQQLDIICLEHHASHLLQPQFRLHMHTVLQYGGGGTPIYCLLGLVWALKRCYVSTPKRGWFEVTTGGSPFSVGTVRFRHRKKIFQSTTKNMYCYIWYCATSSPPLFPIGHARQREFPVSLQVALGYYSLEVSALVRRTRRLEMLFGEGKHSTPGWQFGLD